MLGNHSACVKRPAQVRDRAFEMPIERHPRRWDEQRDAGNAAGAGFGHRFGALRHNATDGENRNRRRCARPCQLSEIRSRVARGLGCRCKHGSENKIVNASPAGDASRFFRAVNRSADERSRLHETMHHRRLNGVGSKMDAIGPRGNGYIHSIVEHNFRRCTPGHDDALLGERHQLARVKISLPDLNQINAGMGGCLDQRHHPIQRLPVAGARRQAMPIGHQADEIAHGHEADTDVPSGGGLTVSPRRRAINRSPRS